MGIRMKNPNRTPMGLVCRHMHQYDKQLFKEEGYTCWKCYEIDFARFIAKGEWSYKKAKREQEEDKRLITLLRQDSRGTEPRPQEINTH